MGAKADDEEEAPADNRMVCGDSELPVDFENCANLVVRGASAELAQRASVSLAQGQTR